ncbi:ATP-binding protein [Streptomyces sp. NPDC001544]|uniref:ATP-binding protein n=1 Tax=Streptomyces sp. NPDC001544 TaxID=3364584 RepID=UPI0036CCCC9B
MKQSAVKTLGVAALGVAIAAVGAGTADAAAGPNAGKTLDGVTKTLPTKNVEKALPGAGQALSKGRPAVLAGTTAARPVADQALRQGPTSPVSGLLGGLPVAGGLAKGLPLV